MAVAFVQNNTSANLASGTSQTITNAAAANVVGNFLVAYVKQSPQSGNALASISSVSDSKNGAYTFAGRIIDTSPSNDRQIDIYYRQNIIAAATGTNTLTATYGATTTNIRLKMLEFSGVLASGSPMDGTTGATGTTGTAASGSITTTVANDLLLGFGNCSGTFTGVGTGWTLVDNSGGLSEYILNAAIGSYNATMAGASQGNWASIVIAFKAAIVLPTLIGSSSGTAVTTTERILRSLPAASSQGTVLTGSKLILRPDLLRF